MNKAVTWTEEELDLMKEKFSISSKEELLEMFYPRSYKSICGKAERMGMKKSGSLAITYWTKDEEDILKENYPYSDKYDFEMLLPNKKWSEIQNKASKMKVRKYNKIKDSREPNIELQTFEEIEDALNLFGHKLLELYRNNEARHVKIITNRGLKRDFRLNKIMLYGANIPISPQNPKFIYDEVKEFIELNNYELLTTEEEYKTTNTTLYMKCNRGHEWKNNFNTFKNGVRCEKCYHEDRGKNSMLSEESIKELMSDKGIELLYFSEYKGYNSKVAYKCLTDESHSIEEDYFSNINKRKSGCLQCALKLKSGESSPNWKGGITTITNWTRGRINSWVVDSLKHSEYKCEITGTTENLEVHHHYPFHKILKETLSELNIDVFYDISKYSEIELDSIKELILKKHYEYGLGKVITEKLHTEFHREFGKIDFTPEDYEKFKLNLLSNNREKEVS